MTDPVSIAISALALAVSITTAWLTLFRRGTVAMTRPSQIYFGPDGGPRRNGVASPKVYLRALLFGTSKRGRIIESMHVSVTRDEARQTFHVWVYGQRGDLERGSGLFVGETGVEASHHFLTVRDTSTFQFREGSYRPDVFAQVLGSLQQKLLFSHVLEVTPDVARQVQVSPLHRQVRTREEAAQAPPLTPDERRRGNRIYARGCLPCACSRRRLRFPVLALLYCESNTKQ